MRIAGRECPTIQISNSAVLTPHLACPLDGGGRGFNVGEPIPEPSGPQSPKVQASISAFWSGGTTPLFPAAEPLVESRENRRHLAGSQQPGIPDTIRDVLDRMAGVLGECTPDGREAAFAPLQEPAILQLLHPSYKPERVDEPSHGIAGRVRAFDPIYVLQVARSSQYVLARTLDNE